MNESSFSENAARSFSKIMKEAKKDSPEHDLRYKFVEYFVKETLGYETRYINWEVKRADLTIVDENGFAVIKIETKKPQEDIDKTEHEEQAFKYEEGETRFIGLTNFKRLKIWEITKSERKLIMDMDFSKLEGGKEISQEEKARILTLSRLSKESLFSPAMYEKFDETYARIDITKDAGFKKLLDRLNYIAGNLLLEYTLKSFGEYREGYAKYRAEAEKADAGLKSKISGEIKQRLAKHRMKLDTEYGKYLPFSGFELWKCHSGKENLPDDEVREVFCKETIYVLLNKLLFIRICEDKGLLPKNISNGGIERLRELMFDKEAQYKEIIETSFRSAAGLYAHFYEKGILDWFRTGDGELDRLLNMVLWTLNQFNFAHVDRDVLGNLYEKYLPSAERKKLGEFYTPVEVIDYILDSAGYAYNEDIRTKDLLDPACGSGGFLVRAARRLISKYLMTFGKADRKELREPKNWKEIISRLSPDEAKIILEAVKAHIFGFDINPFAVHIAEMNMLFQIIDLYQKVREKYGGYKIGKFNIHRTDSLEFPKQKQISDYGSHLAVFEEQEEINEIKQKKFDFVVGNPPYVRVQMLDGWTKEYLKEKYMTAYSNFDLYVVFIERGLNWLKDGGKFGYITSNQFTNREYGKRLRKYILENSKIISIIDFGDSGVFKDATNYPTILIFEKSAPKTNSFKFIRVKQPKDDLIEQIFLKIKEKEYTSPYFDIFEIAQNRLSEEPWQLSPDFEMKILNRIKNKNILLGEKATLLYGTLSGKDDLLMVSLVRNVVDGRLSEVSARNEKFFIETPLLKPIIRGRNIRKWNINDNEKYLIVPHKKVNERLAPIPENEMKKEYAKTMEFFNKNKNILQSRKMYNKTAEELHGVWYSLMYYEQAKDFYKIKIVTPALTNKNNFALDENGYFFVGGTAGVYGIVPNSDVNIKYLLGLLNSKVAEYYLKHICPIKQGGYFQYSTKYLEKLPIKLPETAEEKKTAVLIIKKVDEILSLAKKSAVLDFDGLLKGKETEKLTNIASFSLKDGAKFESLKAEGSRIFINSEDFIEIKEKKTRDFVFAYLQAISEKLKRARDAKVLIYNLEVPKDGELTREIAKKAGFDGAEAKGRIEQLENEINELVYELYGITKEEKGIIEENIR